MKLPNSLFQHTDLTLVGPLGPEVPAHLARFPVIAVDGGAGFVKSCDLWIGDGDSATIPSEATQSIHLSPNKDFSDLAAALDLLGAKPRRLHLWGFIGGRRDHELINFGETFRFLAAHAGSEAFFYHGDNSVAFHLLSSGSWELQLTGRFSLICLGSTTVSMTGECAYPLPAPRTIGPLSSLGLSNEASGSIRLVIDAPVMLCLGDSP